MIRSTLRCRRHRHPICDHEIMWLHSNITLFLKRPLTRCTEGTWFLAPSTKFTKVPPPRPSRARHARAPRLHTRRLPTRRLPARRTLVTRNRTVPNHQCIAPHAQPKLILTTSASSYTPRLMPTTSASPYTPSRSSSHQCTHTLPHAAP